MTGGLGPVSSGPLDFTLEGVAYALDIPADGLVVCGWAAAGNWYALVPGALHVASQEPFYALLGDPYGPVGLRTCLRLVHGLAPAIYGQEWHVAQRLAATASEQWDLYSAWTVSVGFDPEGASAHRVCSSVLAWMRASCQEEKDVQKLNAQLYAPPRVAPKRGRKLMPGFTADDQANAWRKAMAELGPGG